MSAARPLRDLLERLHAPAESVPAPSPGAERLARAVRMAEAVLFAAQTPLADEAIAAHLPEGVPVADVISVLAQQYAGRGVVLQRAAGGWAFRTAPDLAATIARTRPEPRRLSRAALETLAIIAYHQPCTRAEIEAIRGVAVAKGTLDVLLETGLVRMRGRRRTPGRPITLGTTPSFLDHFGLDRLEDLPGLHDLAGLGLVSETPAGVSAMLPPRDDASLLEDEDPLDSVMPPLDPLEGDAT